MSDHPILRRRKKAEAAVAEAEKPHGENSLPAGDKVVQRPPEAKMSSAMMPLLEINTPLRLK